MQPDLLLRSIRRHLRVSQRELARRSGVAQATIERVESGRGGCSLATLTRIVDAAGLELVLHGADGRVVQGDAGHDAVHQRDGRRLPAHLPWEPIVDEQTPWWGWWRIAWSPGAETVPSHTFWFPRRWTWLSPAPAEVAGTGADNTTGDAQDVVGSAAVPVPSSSLPRVQAIRYVTPLREGGSLPGVMEGDDLGTYAVKYSGAGQGRKALIAEVIVGRLAASLDLPTPRLVTVELDSALAANEPDEEIQDLLRASVGLNLGVDFLPGSLDLDVNAFEPDPEFAGTVVVLDALVGNVDRSWRNPNMLVWHGQPYLIDHGAALTFHHNWPGATASAERPYDASQHALIGTRPDLTAGTASVLRRDLPELIREAVAFVPDEWLSDEPGFDSPDEVRAAYRDWFSRRIAGRDSWIEPLTAAARAGLQRAERPRLRLEWLR